MTRCLPAVLFIAWAASLAAADSGLGGSTAAATITVISTLNVPTLTLTKTGFIALFSASLDVSSLNLYDQGGALGAADVVVHGSAGDVRGSLVVDSTLQKITFIASGGVLPPDTYSRTRYGCPW